MARHRAAWRAATSTPEHRLRKIIAGKAVWGDPKLRDKMLPQIKQLGKRKRSPEARQALSNKLKGKPRNWTAEGAERVKATQFKPGTRATWFTDLPPEKQEQVRTKRRAYWAAISPEARAQMHAALLAARWKQKHAHQ